MNRTFGGQSMINPLERVLVKRPDQAFIIKDPKLWNYSSIPDLKNAQLEHDAFVAIIKKFNVDIIYHTQFTDKHADAI